MIQHISRWAGRHVRLAIGLLVVCEVVNGFGGILLGANALYELPAYWLLVLAGPIIAGAVWVRSQRASQQMGSTYRAQRWMLMGAFGSNYLLFVLLGAYWGHTVQTSSTGWAAQGSRRVITRADTLIRPAAPIRKPAVVYDGDGYIVRPVPDRKNLSQTDRQTGKRIGFFLLFLLGLGLALYSTGLSCGLACSGYGALAVVVLALGLGFLAGGVYLLGRTTEHPIVPLREQSLAQRRHAVRRFWLSWLILIGIFGVSLLTCSR